MWHGPSPQSGEKGRERFARTRRGRDEGVPTFQDRGPGLYLAGRRCREPAGEPAPDGRVEVIDRSQASANFVGLTAFARVGHGGSRRIRENPGRYVHTGGRRRVSGTP